MSRNTRMIVIFDPNNVESREMMETIAADLPVDKIEIQRVNKILPGIRATPAVGVLIWAEDMQGLVTDVEAFNAYIKGEDDVLAALRELGVETNDQN